MIRIELKRIQSIDPFYRIRYEIIVGQLDADKYSSACCKTYHYSMDTEIETKPEAEDKVEVDIQAEVRS